MDLRHAIPGTKVLWYKTMNGTNPPRKIHCIVVKPAGRTRCLVEVELSGRSHYAGMDQLEVTQVKVDALTWQPDTR